MVLLSKTLIFLEGKCSERNEAIRRLELEEEEVENEPPRQGKMQESSLQRSNKIDQEIASKKNIKEEINLTKGSS